jgi:hypothetical protein
MPSYYADHAAARRDLAAELSAEDLRRLHQKRTWLHALIAFLNVAAIAGSAVAIVHFDRWYLWLPFAFVAGFAIFDFTVLLHEVVHRAVLPAANDRAYRFLGLLYAMPSGISASQFRAGTSITTPGWDRTKKIETALPLAEEECALAEAAVLHAGALPDLFPRAKKKPFPTSRTCRN